MSGGIDSSALSRSKFGTFGGVFNPCVLTILGVIMFLRFGYVVGQSGLINALLIVVAAKSITVLTSLSLSAIATNARVRGGGAYYMISRSLGVEFGASIGVVFFLAQTISVAMYVIGFSEALVSVFPDLNESIRYVATMTNIAVFICIYIGASWTIRLQYVISAILMGALVSFYVGIFPESSMANFEANLGAGYTEGEDFFTMFALFFPAVTGIMAGANMSGDLESPAKSIPLGTLGSVAFTGVVYITIAIAFAAAVPRELLITDSLVMKQVSAIPIMITAGVFAATISSALGSMMGAPRILQAIARDNIFGRLRFFATGSGVDFEPRRAIVLTFIVSQACILMGDLNTIAPIITMAFMVTYGTLNLATFYESITRNPSYRPQFRYCHWSMSLLGAIGCFAVMFLISPTWAIVLILGIVGIYKYTSLLEIRSNWGDLQSGIAFERARRNLLRLEEQFYHPKNWRPTILALSGAGGNRDHLAVYGHWLTSGHGILSLAQVISGDVKEMLERRRNQEELLRKFIRDQGLEAFPTVIVSQDFNNGVHALVQSHGLGGLRPNLVLLGWPTDLERVEPFGTVLRTISGLDRSIVSIRCTESIDDPWLVPVGTIDVYWRGKSSGPLLLMLAHLLTQNPQWRGKTLRLIRIISTDAGRDEVESHLRELIETSRIRATPLVVVTDDVPKAIRETSKDAAEVCLGFLPPEKGAEMKFYVDMERLAGELPRVLFIWSAGGMELTQ